MPYFLKINQNRFVFPVVFLLDSDVYRPLIPIAIQKVADIDRNRWPICSRIGGRFEPDSLADLLRITQV